MSSGKNHRMFYLLSDATELQSTTHLEKSFTVYLEVKVANH